MYCLKIHVFSKFLKIVLLYVIVSYVDMFIFSKSIINGLTQLGKEVTHFFVVSLLNGNTALVQLAFLPPVHGGGTQGASCIFTEEPPLSSMKIVLIIAQRRESSVPGQVGKSMFIEDRAVAKGVSRVAS